MYMKTSHKYRFALLPKKTKGGKTVWLDEYVEYKRLIFGLAGESPVVLKTIYTINEWTLRELTRGQDE